MLGALIAFLVGLLVGGLIAWYYQKNNCTVKRYSCPPDGDECVEDAEGPFYSQDVCNTFCASKDTIQDAIDEFKGNIPNI